MKLEFLHPPQNDPCQVILLLIVLHRKKARIVWYDWNSGTPLRRSHMHPNRYALPRDEYLPLLLVPLMISTAFLLVCESHITAFEDILTGTPTRRVQSLRYAEEPEDPGLSKRLPLWTQWARPVRSEEPYNIQTQDAIYLCREDGIIHYFEFHRNIDQKIRNHYQAGKLGMNIDAGFAALDIGNGTVDFLIADGDASIGVWRTSPPKGLELLESLASWTPLRNLIATNHTTKRGRMTGEAAVASPPQQRLFACTGRGKYGVISELRYGYRATSVCSRRIQGDAIESGILGMWAFTGPIYGLEAFESRNDGTYILISHPIQTSLLRIHSQPMHKERDDEEPDSDWEFVVEPVNLAIPTRTISSGTTAKGILVIITEASIMVSSNTAPKLKEDNSDDMDMGYKNPASQDFPMISCFEFHVSDAQILAAGMHHDSEKSVILLAIQMNGCFNLQIGHLDTKYEPQGKPLPLDSQPSCVHLQMIGDELVAFVAFLDKKLHVFKINGPNLIPWIGESYEFDGSFAICDSIAIIAPSAERERQNKCLVVCGLRNGATVSLHYIGHGGFSQSFSFCEEVVIGNTSVTVVTDINKRNRVFLHCEQNLCSLEYPQITNFRAPAKLHNIWISDRNQPAFQQGTLSAFAQVTYQQSPRRFPCLTTGSLICLGANHLYMVKIGENSKPEIVTRSLQTHGNPERVTYSSYLNKLIVLSHRSSISSTRLTNKSSNMRGIRIPQPSIAFLDPDIDTDVRSSSDAVDVKQEDRPGKNDKLLTSERKPTEYFIGITEWLPKIGENEYHLLVVSTKAAAGSKPAGRLLIFGIVNGDTDDLWMGFKKAISLEAPAYSVTVSPDRQSIVYCSGNELCILSVVASPFEFKFKAPVKAEMRSPGRSLTINGPYIYVSSARESLVVFKYIDDKIVYQYGDQSARDGLDHILIPRKPIVLASDMTNTIVGLWQPPERRIDNAMITVFEAVLPGSINSLQRITRPIWDRDPDNPQENDTAVIGSSEDGTIIQIDLLFEGYRLLRFIQNMAERNERVCPFKGRGPYKRHIEPSTSKPHHMHINGDIVQRVLDRGAEDLIKEMLDAEPEVDSHTDFDSAQARWERFKELAEEVVDTREPDWLADVVQWARYHLQSAL